jgi:hypothetical protein
VACPTFFARGLVFCDRALEPHAHEVD